MTETIDDITIAYSENGTETTKELDKHVLTKGAWTTIMFKYQDWTIVRMTMALSSIPFVVIKNVIINIGKNRNLIFRVWNKHRKLSRYCKVG